MTLTSIVSMLGILGAPISVMAGWVAYQLRDLRKQMDDRVSHRELKERVAENTDPIKRELDLNHDRLTRIEEKIDRLIEYEQKR